MLKISLLLIVSVYSFMPTCLAQNVHKSDSLIAILKSKNLSKKEQAVLLEAISFYHPQLDSALYYAKKSLKFSLEIDDRVLVAEAYEVIGTIEQQLGNNSQSLEATFKALEIYEHLDLKERQAKVNSQIAIHYTEGKEYMLAIDYLEKAYLIYQKSNKRVNEALALVNLGEIYRLSGDLDKAQSAFLKSLELDKELNNDIILGYSLGNLGMIYAAKDDYENAKEHLTKAITILSQLNDNYSVSVYLSELALLYKKESDYKKAESKLLEAYNMAENAGLKEQIRDFSAMLVALYEEQNNFQKALAFQKVYQIYQDSLVNKTNIKKIEQLKASYEIDKRESEIERINVISSNRKNISIGLAIGIVLFALLAFLLYKAYKKIGFANIDLSEQKKEISVKEQEKALLLKELNHRVKNNLQMVTSLLNLQSNSITDDSAKEVITSGKNRVEALSLVHKKLYQEGIETRVEVKPYVEELVLNLIHGYAADVTPDFIIEPLSINVDKAIPLALIINELVTNTIKHAYTNTSKPKLKIIIQQEEGYLNLEVIDNGIGFNQEDREKTDSLGLKLISSLIKQLDGTYKTVIKNGTHWVINLNIK